MFDEPQFRRPRVSLTNPLVLIACAGGGLLVSLGLCGAAGGFSAGRSSSLGMIGIVLFALSVLCIIGGILWLVIAAIVNAVRS